MDRWWKNGLLQSYLQYSSCYSQPCRERQHHRCRPWNPASSRGACTVWNRNMKACSRNEVPPPQLPPPPISGPSPPAGTSFPQVSEKCISRRSKFPSITLCTNLPFSVLRSTTPPAAKTALTRLTRCRVKRMTGGSSRADQAVYPTISTRSHVLSTVPGTWRLNGSDSRNRIPTPPATATLPPTRYW